MRRLIVVAVLAIAGFGATGIHNRAGATSVGPNCYDYKTGTPTLPRSG